MSFIPNFSDRILNIWTAGPFYYSKESFDETYPGYGSTYSDLQGGLAFMTEQASSRGHVQETNYGEMTFGFTIRNQFLNGIV